MINTNKITRSAILTSLTIILFLLSRIFSIADLTLLTISSIIVCLTAIKLNIKYSIFVLISSTVVSTVFGLIEYSIIYLCFFGSYPILKFYIEKLDNIFSEISSKLVYFNILFLILLLIYLKTLLPIKLTFIVIIFLCITSSFLFLIYDIFLTRIIKYIYLNKFFKNL